MNSILTNWLDDPSIDRGIRFATDTGGWSFFSYRDLAERAHASASQIAHLGDRNQFVVLTSATGPRFIADFYGTLLAGATPVPLAPPSVFDRPDVYVEQVANLLRNTNAVVVTDKELVPTFEHAVRRAGVPSGVVTLSRTAGEPGFRRRKAAETALLQLTSGSTASPRGVCVSWKNLESNVTAISSWLAPGEDAAGAFWLPLYHDMGLVGGMLVAASRGSDLWLMRPDQFIASPVRWLECFGDGRADVGATPNFGLAYVAARVAAESLDGLDFSGWKSLVVGAERVDGPTLARFASFLEPHGFDCGTLLPAYGLAEATLAVTGSQHKAGARLVKPVWSSVSPGGDVEIEADSRLDRYRGEEGWLVSCGHPLEGLELRVEGGTGVALPERTIGEVVVAGNSICSRYGWADRAQPATEFVDGRLRTGDAGFLLDGELFVLGRMSDSFKVRGRQVYAELVEARLAAAPGITKGRCVVFPDLAGGAVAVVESANDSWRERVAHILRRELGSDSRIRVYRVDPGEIPRTSSGKPKRRSMWNRLLTDQAGAALVLELVPCPIRQEVMPAP